MIVRARAPLRLGLAGGGTDVSPYADLHGGYVLNATIDRYAYAVIKVLDDDLVSFNAADRGAKAIYNLNQPFDVVAGDYLQLHKAVYDYIIKNFNQNKRIAVELTTFCDAPAGSGLGASSTLVVAMLRAFTELLNLPLDDYEIARMAYQIERVECGLAGGRQDQYSATFGGFNFMEFYEGGRAVINPLKIKNWILCELEASLVLFYMGISRESAKIIEDQRNTLNSGSESALSAMHCMKAEAIAMKESLLRGDFVGVVDSMKMGWENKKRSAKTVSNPRIDAIYDAAIESGALAGKVSGAGGGGFMLFFVPTESRMEVIRCLHKFDGSVSNCHFTDHGSQAWKIL